MIPWPTTDWEKGLELIMKWKSRGHKIVFTNGCFDLIHPGHIHLLIEAKKLGQKLVVGLNSDQSVRRLKGSSRPIKDEISRGVTLGAMEMVDLVIIFKEDTPLELIRYIKPDILVKGGDYTLNEIIGSHDVMANGGTVEIIPLLKGHSTSNFV